MWHIVLSYLSLIIPIKQGQNNERLDDRAKLVIDFEMAKGNPILELAIFGNTHSFDIT